VEAVGFIIDAVETHPAVPRRGQVGPEKFAVELLDIHPGAPPGHEDVDGPLAVEPVVGLLGVPPEIE